MKLLTRNATALLFEKITSLRHDHDSWRAIHFWLSRMEPCKNEQLRTNFLLHGIEEMLADYEGYVYLCEDGDIIILFQGRAQPILNILARHFGDIKPDYSKDKQALLSVYDFARDWAYFFSLCYRKLIDTTAWERPLSAPTLMGQPFHI